jgi:predicted RNase H-like HicB family nuclease
MMDSCQFVIAFQGNSPYIEIGKRENLMKLTIIIEPDGDGYHAKVPALPGCGTWAKTEAQARMQIKEAIQLYLEPDRIDVKNAHRKAKLVKVVV